MFFTRDKMSNSDFNINYTSVVTKKFIMYGLFYWYVLYPLSSTTATILAAVSYSIISLVAMYFIYITTFRTLYKQYGSILTNPKDFYRSFMKAFTIILIVQFVLSIAFNVLIPVFKTLIKDFNWAKEIFPVTYDNNNLIALFDVISALLYFAIAQHIFKHNFERLKSSYTFSITPTLLILSILFTFTTIGTTYLETFRTQAKEAQETTEMLKDDEVPILNGFLSLSANFDPYSTLSTKYFTEELTYVFSENEIYASNPYVGVLKKYTNASSEEPLVTDIVLPTLLPNGAELTPRHMEITYIDNERIYFVYPPADSSYRYTGNLKPSFYCYDKTTSEVQLLVDAPLYSYNYSGKKQSTTFDYSFIEDNTFYVNSFNYTTKEFKNILKIDNKNESSYEKNEIKKIGDNFVTLAYDNPDDYPDDYYDKNHFVTFYYNNKEIFRYNYEIDFWFPTEDYLVVLVEDNMYKIPYQNYTLNRKPHHIETPFSTSRLKTSFFSPDLITNKYILYTGVDSYYEFDVNSFSLKQIETLPEIFTVNNSYSPLEFYNCNQNLITVITRNNDVAMLHKDTLECSYIFKNQRDTYGNYFINFIKFDIDGNLMLIQNNQKVEPVYRFSY